jgi:hypothetical protein
LLLLRCNYFQLGKYWLRVCDISKRNLLFACSNAPVDTVCNLLPGVDQYVDLQFPTAESFRNSETDENLTIPFKLRGP